jgi:FSR family fosmidomycin resistance protein-like MFS transporter
MDAHRTELMPAAVTRSDGTAFSILIAISFSHLLNDIIQSLLPAIYPILKSAFNLDFSQIGLITLTFQLTASLLQPVVGFQTDRRPTPFSLPIGMSFSLIGLLLLSVTSSFPVLLLAAALVGMGSAVFHPEASRVARMASGGRHGLAQSVFQVGGSTGQALGPLLAAFIVVPRGQSSTAWFSAAALLAMIVLFNVGRWYRDRLLAGPRKVRKSGTENTLRMSRRKVGLTIAVLIALVFSKNFYTASLNSYYTFYLIDKFHLSVQSAQIYLFLFLGSVAAGTLIGGPIGDRFGRKYVIWASVLGVLPFTLALPYADLFWTGVSTVAIGLILASSFPAIIVYAQELVPGKTGTIAGLFFGLSFGMGGLGAALFGKLADVTSIGYVYHVCSFLPAIGLLAAFLPQVGREGRIASAPAAERAVDGAGEPKATQPVSTGR